MSKCTFLVIHSLIDILRILKPVYFTQQLLGFLFFHSSKDIQIYHDRGGPVKARQFLDSF